MCICLNCEYLNICIQYFFVEKKHNELNITKYPTFLPLQSIISINFFEKDQKLEIEWDVIDCLSFKEHPGKWISFY
jgi:hypothetical protein